MKKATFSTNCYFFELAFNISVKTHSFGGNLEFSIFFLYTICEGAGNATCRDRPAGRNASQNINLKVVFGFVVLIVLFDKISGCRYGVDRLWEFIGDIVDHVEIMRDHIVPDPPTGAEVFHRRHWIVPGGDLNESRPPDRTEVHLLLQRAEILIAPPLVSNLGIGTM